MRLAQKRGQHVRCLQIETIVRPVKVRWHNRDEGRAVLARICLAEFDSGNLRDCVGFIRWFQRTGEQGGFWNRLRSEFRVNTGAAKKEQFAHTSFEGGTNDVVLNAQIFEQKLNRVFVVCFYPADLRCRDNHDVRRCVCEKFRNRRFVCEIELRAVAFQHIREPFRFKPANKRASDHPAVAGNENLVGLG